MAKAPSKPTSKTTPKAQPTAKAKAAATKKAVPVKKSATLKTKAAVTKKAMPAKKSTTLKTKATVTKKAMLAKKSTTLKTVSLSKKTPVAKTAVSKTVSAKKNVSAKKATPKIAKATLQTKLDDVAKRLVAADTQTKKNITALETDFSALAKQMGRTKAGQTRLTRRVTELSNTLTKDLESLQDDIRRDLTGALQNPTLDRLQAALASADERLTESEAAQSTALTRINRHISDIATIVEERLSDEASAREAAMAEMQSTMRAGQAQVLAAQAALDKTHTTQSQAMQLRFSNLQSESADAIRSLGDKVVDVAEEMGRRRENLATKLRQELNESTLSANTEFEQFRRVVERRLEALESEVHGIDGLIDRAVAPLSSRIEGLEYGLTQTSEVSHHDYAPGLQAAPPMAVASPLAAPVNQQEAEPAPSYAAPQPAAEDAFSAEPYSQAQQQIPQPQHITQAQQVPLELNEPVAAQAVPYDPQAYPAADYPAPVAQTAAPYEAVTPYQAAAPSYAPADPYAQNSYEQNPQTPTPYDAPQNYAQPQPAQLDYASTQPPFPTAEDLPVIDGDLPYADPAYAEAPKAAAYSDDSMGAARPGAFDNLKKIGRKARTNNATAEGSSLQALMTPRNLKLGGLVAALGLVSVIGVQTLSKKDVNPNGEFSVASNAALDETRPALGQILPAGATNQRPTLQDPANGSNISGPTVDQETIGQYADNRKMTVAEGGQSALTTAAAAGNPVAQLQLGLSQVENGELESGVKLIRAAANQDQPAALYRLAKLYETGQGVGQDSKTARQLTERSARGGNRIAMHDLALYFAEPNGRGGVDLDMPTAAKWFEKAAERGVVDSQYNLGILFESGQGLPQDLESALVWYSIAGAQGDQMAAGRVGVLRQTLSEEQVERADKRIAAFTPSRIDEEANGIFNNVPWAKPSKVADTSVDTANIRQTQTLLNQIGYAVGAADGAIGPKTKNAILNFQRTNSLAETGTVNAELIERLEIAAGA